MDTLSYKSWFGMLASALTVLAYAPYLLAIARQRVQPHVFTWIIWGTATLLAFAATLQGGGGFGAWVIGLSAAISFLVAALAYVKRAEVKISSLDVTFFIGALLAVPLWLWTDDPLSAVLLLTLIELLGFAPTFRKAWYAPYSESISFLLLLTLRNVLILAALEQISLTTTLFPAAAGMACLALVAMMVWRRQKIITP